MGKSRTERNKTKARRRRRLLLLLAVISAAVIIARLAENESALPIAVAYNAPEQGDAREEMRLTVEASQPYRGDLLLVNRDYALREDGVRTDIAALADLEELNAGYGVLLADIRMSEDVMLQFAAMIDAARADGVNGFLINSGYRTSAEQDMLYREQGADYALPAGHSEHQLGIALDIGSRLGEMAQAPEGKWLADHAWRFGFILRYPAHKTEVTGIQYEPWHFRYVGLPHSAVMQERGLVLEEYLELLQTNRQLTVQVEGASYEVRYAPYTPGMTVSVPKDRPYRISGDNRGGIIVTIGPA